MLYGVTTERGECLVRSFIDGLEERLKKKVSALLRYVADGGPPANREKSNDLEGTDGLFEYKPTRQDRIIWFYDGNEADGRMRIVMTHGFRKKNGTPRRETRRGETLKVQYYEARR